MRYIILLIVIVLLLTPSVGCSSGSTETATTSFPNTTVTGQDWLPDGTISDGEYSSSSVYDDLTIYWRSDEENIYIGMRVETDGWLAVAVQPGSRMKDADMYIGYVKDGIAEVQDHFSTGDFGPHSPDTELGGTDDILSFGGSEDDEFTVIEFSRPLDTGDEFDNPFSTGTNKIIWSYSSSDSLSARHSNRGYGEINL